MSGKDRTMGCAGMRTSRTTLVIVALLTLPPLPGAGFAEGGEPVPHLEKELDRAVVPAERFIEEERAREREAAQRLRRARAEHEARVEEAGRKLEADLARQREIGHLQRRVSTLGRLESSLHHEVLSTQQELSSLSRDPADHSALARRLHLERRHIHLQTELHGTTLSREPAMRRLDGLLVR
jgi:hypothetical protein